LLDLAGVVIGVGVILLEFAGVVIGVGMVLLEFAGAVIGVGVVLLYLGMALMKAVGVIREAAGTMNAALTATAEA
jgi:hypothetical protein